MWGILFVFEQGLLENNILFLYSNALACLEKRCWLVVCFCGFQPRMGLRQLAPSCSVGLLILENPYHTQAHTFLFYYPTSPLLPC